MEAPPNKRIRLGKKLFKSDIVQQPVIDLVKSSWGDSSKYREELENAGINIISDPFPVCLVHDLICDQVLIENAIEEVGKLDFVEKSNDLYQFKQSDDVSNLKGFENIRRLYESIRAEGVDWVSKIFGDVILMDNISATFSQYGQHDRLLCHDDKCGNRHIAFIYYMVHDWNKEDGGSLQLFSTDSNGYPHKIVQDILPKFNTLALFKVTHTSFHQVSEVLAKNKIRLSLNGWFHVSNIDVSPEVCKPLTLDQNQGNDKIYQFSDHFSADYLTNQNILHIRKLFSASSEIQLDKFLLPDFWEKVKSDFQNNQIKWITKGPANIRKFEVADSCTLPKSIAILKNIFESNQWFRFLKSITSLDFAPSDHSDLYMWERGLLPTSFCEIQKWSPSNYSLIHDKNPEFHTEALDVILRIPLTGENILEEEDDIPKSGHIIYVDGKSKGEECLLHIGYKYNSLAFVYREAKTFRFTKYLHSESEPFYQIFSTFYPWRPPPDKPDLRHCEEESETDCSLRSEEEEEEDENPSEYDE